MLCCVENDCLKLTIIIIVKAKLSLCNNKDTSLFSLLWFICSYLSGESKFDSELKRKQKKTSVGGHPSGDDALARTADDFAVAGLLSSADDGLESAEHQQQEVQKSSLTDATQQLTSLSNINISTTETKSKKKKKKNKRKKKGKMEEKDIIPNANEMDQVSTFPLSNNTINTDAPTELPTQKINITTKDEIITRDDGALRNVTDNNTTNAVDGNHAIVGSKSSEASSTPLKHSSNSSVADSTNDIAASNNTTTNNKTPASTNTSADTSASTNTPASTPTIANTPGLASDAPVHSNATSTREGAAPSAGLSLVLQVSWLTPFGGHKCQWEH